MQGLIAGILLFVFPHILSSLSPGRRDRLRLQWGRDAFRGLFALTVGTGLVLMAWAYVRLWAEPPGPDFYIPRFELRTLTLVMVFLGFIAQGASYGQSHIRLWLQNPMSIGVVLWAAGHLLANGERVPVLIFSAVLAVALADIAASMARGKRPVFVPRWRDDAIAVLAGTGLSLVLLYGFHPYVLGIPVL